MSTEVIVHVESSRVGSLRPGGAIVAPDGDHITLGLKLGRFYESDLLDALVEDLYTCASKGQVVVDVGAHVGNHSLFFMHFCPVVAFEPNPHILTFTRKTFSLNRRSDCCPAELHEIALSDRSGEIIHMHTPDNTGSSQVSNGEFDQVNIYMSKVPCRRLDSFGLKNVGLIKIDVERHELQVLDGAVDTISETRPVVVCEAHDQIQVEAISARLKGYTRSKRYCASPTYIWRPT